jgi:hypothetical protein
MAPRERGCNQTLCYGKYTFVLYLHSLSFYTYIFVVGPLSKLAYTVHISSAEGYTKYDFAFCVVLIQSIVIFKKKGGYILKIITKLYVSCNDDTTSFCYKSLITILVVMMIRRRRWTVMIWNILRMLLTI